MKWLIDISMELAKKVNGKQAYRLLICIIVCVAGYMFLDRYLSYKEAADPNNRVIIEKTYADNYDRNINNEMNKPVPAK